MKIELLDYALENEDTRQIYADLTILADGIQLRWHIIPGQANREQGWVICHSGIGAPGDDYDLSGLSAEARSLLLGERHGNEEIQDFERRVEAGLEQQIRVITGEVTKRFLKTLEAES
jgi:hypothetical protein